METMIKLLASLLLLVLGFECSSAYNCYSCSSTINEKNEELESNATYSCAQALGLESIDNPSNRSCKTSYEHREGVTSIERGLDWSSAGLSNSCDYYGTTCYCNTSNNCNNEKIAVPRSYDCHECVSSVYFDNGCGSTLDPDSKYVRQIKGCSACYKTSFANVDHTLTYRRGCSRSIDIQEGCVYTDLGQIGQSCACKGPLCNSAETVALKPITVFAAVVLSAVFKLIC